MHFNVTIVVLYVFLFFSCKSNTTENYKSPNIVFILADDLGIHDLSITGSNYYETPNIDNIAKEGTVFANGYAASSVCSPSRASILTGQSPAMHGITDWIGAASGVDWRNNGNNTKIIPPTYNSYITDASTTLSNQFKNAGYNTFFAGKWHLGDHPNHPERYGFNINVGGWKVGSPKGGYFAPWINPNLKSNYKGENLSIRLAEETAKFITLNKNKPFFAYLSFYAVHGPIETTQSKWQKYRNKAQKLSIADKGFKMERILPIRTVQDNPIYAGLIEQMDDAIGIVLAKLKELGLDSNTIIVFTSDNGGVASGDAFSTTNLPQRGGKGYQWEGGIRVPYFIKVPYKEHQPTIVSYAVTGADLYPTLLELAGISSPKNYTVEGKSLVPLLENENMEERPLFWHYPHYGNQGGEPASIIRKGDYKLIHYWEDGRNELYNLNTDEGEQDDLSVIKPNKTRVLYDELKTYLAHTKTQVPEFDELFDLEKSLALKTNRETVLLPKLEEQRQQFLSPDFNPNNNWWDSALTKD